MKKNKANILKHVQYKLDKNTKEIADFLGVYVITVYNWEKKDQWPSWALKKCGISLQV